MGGANFYAVAAHQLAGVDIDRFFLGAFHQEVTVNQQVGNVGVSIGVVGIITPELDVGAGLYADSNTLFDYGSVGDNVEIVRSQHHILFDDGRQDISGADILFHLALGGIDSIITFIQSIFAPDGDINRKQIIVGAVLGNGNQEGVFPTGKQFVGIDLAAVLGRICTDRTIIYSRIMDSDIGIFDTNLGQSIDSDQGVFTHTPAVCQHQAQSNGLAGIDDTVAIIFIGILGIVKEVILLQMHFRLGQLRQGSIQIDDLGHIVRSAVYGVHLGVTAGGIIIRSGCQLAVDKLGGILIPVFKLAPEDGSHSRDHGRRHRSAGKGTILVVGQGGDDGFARGVQFILPAVEPNSIPVGKCRLNAALINAHNAQNISQGSRIAGKLQKIIRILIGIAAVTGGSHQHATGVGSSQSILHSDRAG